MTTEIIFASNKLGNVHNEQLQLMLDKFHLGQLISSTKTANGAMGQTMLITSTEGKFVLKGNPLYPGQLVEEKFFIENLHKRTKVKVPIPYRIDDSEEIFGWSYSLMPCLQGEHMNSGHFQALLNAEDKHRLAEAIAETLREFHRWKVKQFGELDTGNFTIVPFKEGYVKWLYNRIMFWLEDAKKYSVITTDDIKWTETLLEGSRQSFETFTSPTFVMGDFKPGNFLINNGLNGWEISGVFDFTNAYFGDPVSDLIKMMIYYMDNGEQEIAKHLLNVYLDDIKNKEAVKNRLKIHMLQQRVLDWGCAKAINMVTWDPNLPFSQWVETYTNFLDKE
ncbi:aminoglycoside phosphotransferase family protein [Bacillus sp. APMAM]|nr:aminoglycoside phosphotransferase family protein [Bacillus sp. APMAM]RTZ54080.1 aminoglycoside phosphotransferase family protein [Bacillus sp. SAJ1]